MLKRNVYLFWRLFSADIFDNTVLLQVRDKILNIKILRIHVIIYKYNIYNI